MKTLGTLLILITLLPSFSYGQRRTNIDESIAIIDAEFPTRRSRHVQVHPLQEKLSNGDGAFYPNKPTSDLPIVLDLEPEALKRLNKHGLDAYKSIVAGRTTFPKPFLMNESSNLATGMQSVIDAGVRVFSISMGFELINEASIEAVIRKNPEVIFVVSTPHIAGNSITVKELNQTPSRLALRYKNVILAGSMEFRNYHLEREGERGPVGSRNNDFEITSQESERAREYFMLNTETSQEFAPGFGQSSAAAPHLANLLSLVIRKLKASGEPTTRDRIIENLDAIMHEAFGSPAYHKTKRVKFFTLDTVLANLRKPLITNKIWPPNYQGDTAPRKIGVLRSCTRMLVR